jgi:hypothetical protein
LRFFQPPPDNHIMLTNLLAAWDNAGNQVWVTHPQVECFVVDNLHCVVSPVNESWGEVRFSLCPALLKLYTCLLPRLFGRFDQL